MPAIEESKKALDKARVDAEEAVYDWLSGLGSDGAIKVTLKRTFPPEHQGIMVKGTLGHYDQPITEEEVKAAHGGGRFQVIVKTMSSDGRWKYAGSRTFEVAGPPKIDALIKEPTSDAPATAAPTNGVSDSLGQQAMSAMLNLTKDAQTRAREATGNSGPDWEMMERLLKPMRDDMAEMRTRLADKDAQILNILGKEPDTSGQDRLFGLMESKETSYGNSLNALRTQHDSELRSLREFNREEIRRREARFEKEIESVRTAAQREIDSLKMAHTQALDSLRMGYDMRIDGLKDIQSRLESDMGATKTELSALRAKKEIGPLDQIQNLVTLKSGFDALVPAAAPESSSGWAKAAEIAGPLVEGIAMRVMGGGGQDEPAAAAGQIEEGAPSEELVSVRRADGRVVQVPRSTLEQMRRDREQAQAQAQDGDGEPQIELDQEDVSRAISLIEAAMRNGTDPETLARSARNMVPDAILAYIKRHDIDAFLNNVAKLDNSSPLATVAGRTYIRKVAKYLLEGTTEGVQEPEPQASPVESS